ncbi:MAG: ABC transporter ATP-binding protein [Alistipes sp.]|nr:ABC transporter ATP-binding protein [Alistipes sp.]MBQ8543623.1 ABC transporter ATP-binding protein [Alistipes sp.]
MQHTSIITLRNVGVNYEQSIALEDVNLDIFEDDFIGIIGPNGGGKTSLVKAIMGVVPHSGEIEFAPALQRKSHLKIGYMPQVSQFDTRFPISIEEVVLSGLQSEKGFFGRYTHADRQRATELLKQMGIDQIASRPIGEVSGGQLQRALLCRAIIAEPKLLILDEPTNFVDNNFEREFYALVKQLHERMAVMIVSHDVGTITSLVNAIICVNRHVHRHDSNILTEEQLLNYDCPIQVVSHGHIPHTVLEHHTGDGCKHH